MSIEDIAVAISATREDAEEFIEILQRSGFSMSKLSVIGRDCRTEEHVFSCLNGVDRGRLLGHWGALAGTTLGMLLGSAFMTVPSLGRIVVLGPLAAMVADALEGALIGGGLSAFGSALMRIGIARDSVLQYERALKAGKFLVVVHGTSVDIGIAKAILCSSLIELSEHAIAV